MSNITRALRLSLASIFVISIAACSGGGAADSPTGPSGNNDNGSGGSLTIASVTVSPNAGSVLAGSTRQFTATARDASGNTLAGQAYTWSVSPASVATVSSAGLVTGVSAGAATLTVKSAADPTKSSTATLIVSTPPSGSGTVLVSGVTVSGISGALGQTRLYRVDVPTGATKLDVQTTGGTGDIDIYVRAGQSPTTTTYDCISGNVDSNERCEMANPSAGTWYILMNGFTTYSGVTVTATVTVPSTSATYVGAFTTPPYRVFGTSSLTGAVCNFDVTWSAATVRLTYSATSPGGAATIQVTGRRISTPVTSTATGPGGTSNCTPGDDTQGGTASFASSLPQVNTSVAYSVYGNSAVTETAALVGTADAGQTTINGTLTFTYTGSGRGGVIGSTTVTLTRQ
ncbi:MAG: pre-peptidase C-terminal domain-containing protein [Gemmatimonadetes bacterium]|nr:pre-peptidase C-terminal domain-containing protein [Gemmatimonadota bacterium]